MNLKNKLKIYGSYVQNEKKEELEVIEKHSFNVESIPNLKEWEKHGVKPYVLEDSYCLIKEKRYSIHEKRGIYSFKDLFTVIDAWQKSNLEHPLSTKGFSATDLFFFDTETTGLGTGVGNTIFLLGYTYVDGEEVVLKQHLLPEPSGEIPLYYSFLEEIDYTTLVTYNGKAFDWPQLKTRYTLIREHLPKLPPFGHFDLLHAARRLWKHKLESVSLSNVEKHILGIERDRDVPGFLAPMIYFDFVQTKELDGIVEVMKHNEEDILSLLILYTHISMQLLGLDPKVSGREQLSVGHWYSYLKQPEVAIEALEQGLAVYRGEERWKALNELAFQYKKLNKIEKAMEKWQEVVEDASGKTKITACIEVAKIYEHQLKDYHKAMEYSLTALKEHKMNPDSQTSNTIEQDLLKRIDRLDVKISRFPG